MSEPSASTETLCDRYARHEQAKRQPRDHGEVDRCHFEARCVNHHASPANANQTIHVALSMITPISVVVKGVRDLLDDIA